MKYCIIEMCHTDCLCKNDNYGINCRECEVSFKFWHCSCEVIDDVAVQRMACDVQNVIKIVGATSSESVLVETVPSRHHELLF